MILTKEYRGDLLENVHPGRICVVKEDGQPLHTLGDAQAPTFYRSSSKPFQVIPLLEKGLDQTYQLTDKEIAIMTGSHAGEPVHLTVILGLLEKCGLLEEDLIMNPSHPANSTIRDQRIRDGLPPRKALHNCAGKHIAAMLLQRELTGSQKDYWKPESPAQQEIRRAIARIAQVDAEEIQLGIDGCGVPVFAVSLLKMANSYLRFACPDQIKDPTLQAAIQRLIFCMHQHPVMVRGNGYLCTIMNQDANLVAKGGAQGVYCFGLRAERIGVALKMEDGEEGSWPVVLREILRQLGYQNKTTLDALETLRPNVLKNDGGIAVGTIQASFTF